MGKHAMAGLDKAIYFLSLRIKLIIHNLKNNRRKKYNRVKQKYLYASPVGKAGKDFLKKIITKLGKDDFDYLIFSYDGTDFSEDIFRGCSIIHDKGLKWYFAKKYLTPKFCRNYDYIFFWDEDIDIDNFSYTDFIEIMKRNNLELAHPACSLDSDCPHQINFQDKRYAVGRYSDFIEIMAQVFTSKAWESYWKMIEAEYNFWGWGYTHIANSFCKYSSTAIIDSQVIKHTRPLRKVLIDDVAEKQMQAFLKKYAKYRKTMFLVFGKLK